MTTIYFKTAPAASAKSFSAIYLEVFYESDNTVYTTIAGVNRKVIHSKHKGWKLVLGYISAEADLDYLAELKEFDYPEFSLNGSTYYDIIIKSIDPKPIGSTITIIKQVAE